MTLLEQTLITWNDGSQLLLDKYDTGTYRVSERVSRLASWEPSHEVEVEHVRLIHE